MKIPEEGSVTVRSLKYDGSVNRQWQCKLVSASSEEVILKGEFKETITHSGGLGEILAGTVSYEFFRFDKWYNIFRFHEPSGILRNYYCNICTPPVFSGTVLDYVDLDIDVIVWPNGVSQVLDLDEFRDNSEIHGYSEDVIRRATESLQEVLTVVKNFELPQS